MTLITSVPRDLEVLIRNFPVVCDKACMQRGRHHRCYDFAYLKCKIYNGKERDVKSK